MEEVTYQCSVSNNLIEFQLEKEIAYCINNYIDEEYLKAYFVLLRSAIQDLQNKGYKKMNQVVSEDEYNQYLKNDNRWTIIQTNQLFETIVIECDLESALECICKGFGIKL